MLGLSRALAPSLLLLLLLSWCEGAPVPDAATQVFSGLDLMLTSLGAERQRRAAGYDKELNLEDLGVSLGLSYHDTNRKVRGGKVHVDTPKANFVLDIDRDRGVTTTEGSFSFDLGYTINESGDRGKFTIERIRQEDGQLRTKIHNLPPDTDLVPMLNLDATSDFKTKVDLALSFSYKTHHGNVKIKLMRGTEEFSLDCAFEYNGKKYAAKGSLNKDTRTGDLLVVSPLRDYTLKGKVVTRGDTKITAEGDMMGKVSFVMNIKQGNREAKIQLTHKKAKLLQMKLRGQKVGDDIEAEAKWALLGGKVAKGTADASVVAGSTTVVVTPEKGRPITVSAYYPPQDDEVTKNFGFSATKGAEKLFSYDGKLERKDSADTYEVGFEMDVDLREKSLMYSTGCRIGSLVGSGCFKTRKISASFARDKNNDKRLSLHFSDIKDGEGTLEFTFNTLNSPYKVEVISPLLTSSVGADRVFVMVDYQPGTSITAETSYRQLKLEMRTEKTAEGRKFFAEMWREGEKNINYNLDVQFQQTEVATNIHSRSNFDIRPESLLYPVFCSYGSGCFRHRESEVDIFIDNQNKNWLFSKFRLGVTMSKDSREAFSLLADTTRSPYKFEMAAPQILTDLIGVESLEADITHTVEDRSYQFSPTSQLLISSTHPQVKTFEIQSSDDGIFVKQNAQLLMKVVNFIGGRDSNSLEADVEFRNSKKARLNMNWQNNEVVFTVVGDGLKITGNIQSAEENLDFDISGVVPILGNFALKQSLQWKTGDILGLTAKGLTETEAGLLAELDLSPIKNDIKLDWDKINWIINGHVTNHFKGEKYEIVFQDNSISIDM